MQNFTKTTLFKYLQCYLFLATVISSQPVMAQNFRLLKDINTSTDSKPSNSYNLPDGRSVSAFAVLNNIAYFAASDSGKNKLWRSDGTANGTYVLDNSSAGFITRCGDKIYYVSDSAYFTVLKVTDGTAGGTAIVKSFSSEIPVSLVAIQNTLHFILISFADGFQWELWKSAGTRENTSLIKQFPGATNNILGLADVNGTAFFINYNPFDTSDSLDGVWKSDGTASGTTRVFSGSRFGVGTNAYAYNGKYFYAAGSFYNYLYVTDGSPSGTLQLTQISYPHDFISLNGITYFSGTDELHGEELWRTDGTKAGTYVLKDIQPGRDSSSPEDLTVVGNDIYFHAKGANGNDNVWKIDGTSQAVALVKDFGTGKLIAPYGFTNLNGTLFFIAYEETTGAELWKSEGSEGGTVLVKDIWPGESNSYPDYLTALGNKLLFAANDGLHGIELWSSDGTATNTLMLKDINTGYTSGGIDNFKIAKLKDKIFFTANSPENTVLRGYRYNSLWSSDGTEENTKNITGVGTNAKISAIDNNYFATENRIYFTALDNHYNKQLWYTDNNVTKFITNIIPESSNPIGDPYFLNIANLPGPFYTVDSITYYFTLNNLWQIDEGTNIVTLVANIPRGSFFKINDQLLIASGTNLYRKDGGTNGITKISTATLSKALGDDQVAYTNDKGYFLSGNNLWKTDGTDAGTTFLNNVKPLFSQGRKLFFSSSNNTLFTNINNTLFFAGDDGTTGQELWKTDGTPAGTQLVKDINPGTKLGLVGNLCAVGNHVFFLADDGVHGTELWKTDGTDTGTVMVKDINTSVSASYISSLTKFGDKLAFVAFNTSTNRYGIWQSDGTEAGTFPADAPDFTNILTGNAEPAPLYEFNGELYVDGTTTQYGSEIWVGTFAAPVLPFSLVNFNTVINQDKVDLKWATVNETNTKSITVQRGTDSTHFTDIATIDAKGGDTNNYSYIDPVSAYTGKLFYRLLVVDKDGKETYSDAIEINLPNNRPVISVGENPVSSILTIAVNNINASKTALITIVNSSGVIFINDKVTLTAGVNTIKYNVAGWGRGIYVLKIRLEDGFEKKISIVK